MRLHEENAAFTELVQTAAQNIGLPQIYVEKDYWITRALKFLANSPRANEVVFKGGTSLSKGYRLIDRFSEDIDLAVFAGSQSGGARKKQLKDIEAIVSNDLTNISDDVRVSKGSRFRKTVYQYPRSIEANSFGQASSELLVEVNTFTNPSPFETCELQSFIAEALTLLDQKALIAQYELEAFPIQVLSVERTLTEKILGVIKDSYHEDPIARLSDRIRHLYDICLILREEKHRAFVRDEKFSALCEACISEERAGNFDGNNCFNKPLREAPLFHKFEDWRSRLDATYRTIFSDLVYGELPNIEEISATLTFIHKHLD